MDPCLDDAEVRHVAQGLVPIDANPGLAAHLDACPDCRLRVVEQRSASAGDAGAADRWAGSSPSSGMTGPSTALREHEALRGDAPELRPGEVIDNRYELARRVGSGGMGVVWAARDRELGRSVALKFLLNPDKQNPARALAEARATARIQHPNIVGIHHVVAHKGSPVLVMEMLEGETLRQRLSRGPLSLAETAQTMVSVCYALAAIHARNFVHRDLKPENIFLVAPSGMQAGVVRLLDLGLARPVGTSDGDAEWPSLTRSGVQVGTQQYMSPEQASGVTNFQSDLWALGVILYECLAGRRPADVYDLLRGRLEPIERAVPGVPRSLGRLVRNLLRVDCDERTTDVGTVIKTLELYLPADDQRVGSLTRALRRRWITLGVAVALLLVALLATGGALWQRQRHAVVPGTRDKGTKSSKPARLLGGSRDAATSPCVVEVALGLHHTCARKQDNTLWCWGSNDSGQVGDGTTELRLQPVQVAALGSHVVGVSAGADHTCARMDDDSLRCWGYNYSGQVGDGSYLSRRSPVTVATLGNSVAQVAAGQLHTCARKTDGTIWCWGNNYYGNIGDGSTHKAPIPVPVKDISGGAIDIAAGGNHTCARTGGIGSISCWGRNHLGQFGNNATSEIEPRAIWASAFEHDNVELATGFYHTCVRHGDGRMLCCGKNSQGELGHGAAENFRLEPVEPQGIDGDVVQIATGFFHTCLRKSDGTAWCWGSNGTGQVGDGTVETPRRKPTRVMSLGDSVIGIAANADRTCAIKADGSLWCWGSNSAGEIGDGTVSGTPRTQPQRAAISCP